MRGKSWEQKRLVKEVISAIRNIRGENRISPAIKIKVRLVPNGAEAKKHLENNKSALITMGRTEELIIGDEGNLSKCALSVVDVKNLQVKVIIPLEGLVDIDEEVKRLQKNIEKANKEIQVLNGKLNNESFVKNAAEEVVEADRALLEQSKKQLVSMQDALSRLK